MTVSSSSQLIMTGARLKFTASYGGVQLVYVLWRFTMQLSTAKLIANGENFQLILEGLHQSKFTANLRGDDR